jgi:hypothetical protein
VLGTTRQAAFQRFGHPVDPRTGTLMSHDVPLHFEAGDGVGSVRFDREGKVAGLIPRPASPAPSVPLSPGR